MRNTLKHLEGGLFCHSPSKRIFLDLDESAALNNLHLSPPTASFTQDKVNVEDKMDEGFPAAFGITAANDILTMNVDRVDMGELPSLAAGQLPLEREDNSSESRVADSESIKLDAENMASLTNAITAFQGPTEKSKLSTLSDVDIQSLMGCSVNQLSLRDPALPNSPTTQHTHMDELDNIMQVLVGMWQCHRSEQTFTRINLVQDGALMELSPF